MTNSSISLQCPGCKANLSGDNISKVFFCLPCGWSFNVDREKGELLRYGLITVEPKLELGGEGIYFPFWQLECAYRVEGRETGAGETVGLFYVPAFLIRNINYFGDTGFQYVRKRVVLTPGPARNYPILSAARDIRSAVRYPHVYLSREFTGTNQAAPQISVTPRKASVALVPFFKKDQQYVDTYISWKYPTGAML